MPCYSSFFFFNDTATTEIYTLSLTTLFRSAPGGKSRTGVAHCRSGRRDARDRAARDRTRRGFAGSAPWLVLGRSEEHTSELQSQSNLVCRLLLEKKNSTTNTRQHSSKLHCS